MRESIHKKTEGLIFSFLRQLFPQLLCVIPSSGSFPFIREIEVDFAVPFTKVHSLGIPYLLSRWLRTAFVQPESTVGAVMKPGFTGWANIPETDLFRQVGYDPAGGTCYSHFRPLNSFRTASAFLTDFFTQSFRIAAASSMGIRSNASPLTCLYRSTW